MITQGPWLYRNGVIFGADRIGVGEVQRKGYPDVANANGALMAAAPEMFQALQDVAKAYQQMFDVMPVAWQTVDDIVSAAIAKATTQNC